MKFLDPRIHRSKDIGEIKKLQWKYKKKNGQVKSNMPLNFSMFEG